MPSRKPGARAKVPCIIWAGSPACYNPRRLGIRHVRRGSQGMNNHLIACVLALVGCLAVPLGGQRLSTADSQYFNETEAPAPDDCQIFEGAVLAPLRTYHGALFARASGPATVLSILDDNVILNP